MPVLSIMIDNISTEINYDEADLIEIQSCDFIPAKIGSVKRTSEGYLKGVAAVAKVGVMTYLQADGTIRKDFVPPETLFNKDSMETMHLQPMTDTHPEEILLDNTTVKRKKVGSTGENVYQDGDYLMTSLVITDNDAIANVDSGRQELSPGYKSYLIAKDGEYKGVKYNHIQIKRVYNHVAICDRARGGKDLRLNIDSLDNIDGFQIDSNKEQIMGLKKYTYKGINYDAAEELIVLIDELNATISQQKTVIDAKTADVSKVQAALDAKTADVSKLQATIDSQQKMIDEINKSEFIAFASKLVDEETAKKFKDISMIDGKKLLIKTKNPTVSLDGKDDNYINTYVDVLKNTLQFDSTAIGNQRSGSTFTVPNSDSGDPIEKARLASEKAIMDAANNFGKDGE